LSPDRFSKAHQLDEAENPEAVRCKRIFESGFLELNNIGFIRLNEGAGETFHLKNIFSNLTGGSLRGRAVDFDGQHAISRRTGLDDDASRAVAKPCKVRNI